MMLFKGNFYANYAEIVELDLWKTLGEFDMLIKLAWLFADGGTELTYIGLHDCSKVWGQ